jgi:hypothetical protein
VEVDVGFSRDVIGLEKIEHEPTDPPNVPV